MSEVSHFSDSRRLNYESKLLSERLEKQYLRQKIDSQINSRFISSPERDREQYRSPVRDDNRRYLSPSTIHERLLSNYSISNIQRNNQFLGDSIKRLNAHQKGYSLYQSPNKVASTTSNNPDYQRNVETFLQFDMERKQREQRKRDIMNKINELNNKLQSESSYVSHANAYTSNLGVSTSQNNLHTQNSYTSPASRYEKIITSNSSIGGSHIQQLNQPSYYLTKYEQQQQQQQKSDQVAERTSPKLESQPAPENVSNLNTITSPISPHGAQLSSNLRSETSPKNEQSNLTSSNNATLPANSISDQKYKQEIHRLESDNSSLKQKLDQLEKNHDEIVQKLKEQNSKEADQYKLAYEAEKKKNEALLVQCQKFETNIKQQNEEMSQSLKQIELSYKEKLKQFESLLSESNSKIQNLQTQYLDDPLIKAIKENPQILDLITEKLNEEEGQSQDPQIVKRVASLEKLLERKEEIIKELSRNNELKDLEIKKMEELIEKFKALFSHMNEEKEILTAENDRLNDELEQYKSYITKLMVYSSGGKKDEEGDGEVAERQEEYDDQQDRENEAEQDQDDEQQQQQQQEGDDQGEEEEEERNQEGANDEEYQQGQ
ncbi:hypothetical protein TTHERM_00001120 (macronuclear) [Tetrahymena thermophila SB210]|uniref:Uncharacterized protein n=1 Tax=Tetrahymena thermophila (strain SB210) TaxID=312017 RepID=Q22SM5_TETTS|nr:hypothetical protein TTHERM_00001120 [Tetrahymena thermophila SB210]EAR87747.2 hypothetical protein TTHERM_00001120 [Tetrahymena thermophila SB210]|eukprot:XP_001007992.2 hypothetical protein TTHERM_00001120 [Tetrahymena thermophila SB210]